MIDPFDPRLPRESSASMMERRQRNREQFPQEVCDLIETVGLLARSMFAHELDCEECGNPFGEPCATGRNLQAAHDTRRKRLRQIVKQYHLKMTV